MIKLHFFENPVIFTSTTHLNNIFQGPPGIYGAMGTRGEPGKLVSSIRISSLNVHVLRCREKPLRYVVYLIYCYFWHVINSNLKGKNSSNSREI